MLSVTHYLSPVGKLLLASKDGALTGLWIQGQKYFPDLSEGISRCDDLPVFRQAACWLDRYFAGSQPDPAELELSPAGSEFRQSVWKLLCAIPYGSVTTYGEIARQIALQKGVSHMSSQAVGGAVAHNPISIIIPCHRVVGSNKSLTGYAGGIEKKLWLLNHEQVNTDLFFLPKKGTAL